MNYNWTRKFVVEPLLKGEVALQPVPENTYEFQPESSKLEAGLKTVGFLGGAILLGLGIIAAAQTKK
jgi:hypothetical protein